MGSPLTDGRPGKEGQEVETEEGRRIENGKKGHIQANNLLYYVCYNIIVFS